MKAYLELKKVDASQFKRLRGAGIKVHELVNHIPHVLVDEPVKIIPFSLPPKTSASFATSQRKLTGSIAELEGAGISIFDKNVISSLAKRGVAIDNVEVMRNFTDEIAKKFGVAKSKAFSGYVKANVGLLKKEVSSFANFVRGEAGEELMFHPAIAKKMEEFSSAFINDEATNKAFKVFDDIQRFWKASVTSIFPSFHGRNALSNVFLHYLDIGAHSLNPLNHAMSADLLLKEHEVSKLARTAFEVGDDVSKGKLNELLMKPIMKDAMGHTWTFGELRSVLKNNQVALSPSTVGPLDVQASTRELVETLFPEENTLKKIVQAAVPTSQQFSLFKAGRTFGSIVEEQARLVDFMVNLKKTGDPILAAQRTKMFLFDYANLTGFEKTFLRRLIPFYSFTRFNLEAQVRSLLTVPGRVAAEATVVKTLGDVVAGDKLTEEESAALPDWIKTGINILKKKNGQTVEIFGSLGTPIEQPFQALQPNQIMGSISPLLRVPAELATGYNFYRQKSLSEVTNAAAFARAPEVIKDFIGYTEVKGERAGKPFTWYVSLRPERMHVLLNLPPTARVLSSLKQIDAVDVSAGSKLLQQFLGVRPYSFDLEQESAKREKELREELENLLTSAGVVAKYKRVFIPKD